MRTHGSAQQLEQRRRQAVALLDAGWSPQEVAEHLGASRRSVERWRKAAEDDGPGALAAKPHPGRKPFLTIEQKDDLVERLIAGAVSQGFDTDLWTCPRVQELIEYQYGVSYHVDHISRLLRSLGFRPQKPQRRALERDEQSIATWVREDWPRIKKRRPGFGRTSFSRTKPAFL
jgi:transposase